MSEGNLEIRLDTSSAEPPKEPPNPAQIDQELRAIVADPLLMGDLAEVGRRLTYISGADIATGDTNRADRGGWSEVAQLRPDGALTIGVRTSRGWATEGEGAPDTYKLANVHDARQAVVDEQAARFSKVNDDPKFRRLTIPDFVWADETSPIRQHFSEANRPSMDKFAPVPAGLEDSQGVGWVSTETGHLPTEHPLYPKLLGKATPAQIRVAVQSTISTAKARLG